MLQNGSILQILLCVCHTCTVTMVEEDFKIRLSETSQNGLILLYFYYSTINFLKRPRPRPQDMNSGNSGKSDQRKIQCDIYFFSYTMFGFPVHSSTSSIDFQIFQCRKKHFSSTFSSIFFIPVHFSTGPPARRTQQLSPFL